MYYLCVCLSTSCRGRVSYPVAEVLRWPRNICPILCWQSQSRYTWTTQPLDKNMSRGCFFLHWDECGFCFKGFPVCHVREYCVCLRVPYDNSLYSLFISFCIVEESYFVSPEARIMLASVCICDALQMYASHDYK